MLADCRATEFRDGFAAQWLNCGAWMKSWSIRNIPSMISALQAFNVSRLFVGNPFEMIAASSRSSMPTTW
jgi:hypothetical protein